MRMRQVRKKSVSKRGGLIFGSALPAAGSRVFNRRVLSLACSQAEVFAYSTVGFASMMAWSSSM